MHSQIGQMSGECFLTLKNVRSWSSVDQEGANFWIKSFSWVLWKTSNYTETEKDLGVLFTSNLKFSNHIRTQSNKATSILGQLKRTFRFWTIYTFKIMYSAFIRPHLEYAATVWSPYIKKDIKTLERVQRRATKLMPRIRNWSYSERLSILGLTTLEDRRIKGDFNSSRLRTASTVWIG